MKAAACATAVRAHASVLLVDGVAQHADAFDLYLAHVARLHEARRLLAPAYARRRAGGDHIARNQREDRRRIADELRNAEDHVARVAALHHLAVEPGLELEFAAG